MNIMLNYKNKMYINLLNFAKYFSIIIVNNFLQTKICLCVVERMDVFFTM